MESSVPPLMLRSIASLVVLGVLPTVFLALRIYTRIAPSQPNRLWVDDYCLILAWMVFVVQLGLRIEIFRGATIPTLLAVRRYSRLGHIAGILSNVAWSLSKTSFSLTLMRLVTGTLRFILGFIIVSMNLFIIIWLPLFLNPCEGNDVNSICMSTEDTVKLGIFVGAYSAFIDFLLSMLPWKVIWPAHLTRRDKLGVCIAMSMGVFAGATGIVKCFYLVKFDPTSIATAAGLYIWESAEISATIMAASIPMLRKLAVNATTRDATPESGQNVVLSNFRRQLRIFGLQSEQMNDTTTSSHR